MTDVLKKMTGPECYEHALWAAEQARQAEDRQALTSASYRWREALAFAALANAAASVNNEYVDSREWDIAQGKEVPSVSPVSR